MKGVSLGATGASPPPPFRLSHLEISLLADDGITAFEKLLLESRDTLTSLVIWDFPYSQSTAASVVSLFSRTSFPNLRRLGVSGAEALIELLPLHSLQSLTVNIDCLLFRLDFFGAIGNAVPPTLLFLRLKGHGLPLPHDPSNIIADIWSTLDPPRPLNLRQLYLPETWRRADWLSAQNARNLEAGCEERGIFFAFG